MLSALNEAKLIETDTPREVAKDLEAVLEGYLRDEQDIASRARDLAASRQLSSSEHGRLRRQLAEQRGIRVGDDAIDYLLEQLVEMLMMSSSVDELFGEDHEIKRALRQPLRAEFEAEDAEEQIVRKRMKHVSEGTAQWEVEYQRIRREIGRRRG